MPVSPLSPRAPVSVVLLPDDEHGQQPNAVRWEEMLEAMHGQRQMLEGMVSQREDEAAFNEMIEGMLVEAGKRQRALDVTCDRASMTYLHLLLFNSVQLIVLVTNLEAHVLGDLRDVPYRWYWVLGDIFHAVVGVLFMSELLIAYALTSYYVDNVLSQMWEQCERLHMAAARRGVLMANLRGKLFGARVGQVAITLDFCTMFLWAMSLTVCASLNTVFIVD